MKFSFAIIGLIIGSVGFAAPAKKAPAKATPVAAAAAPAAPAEQTPVTIAPATTDTATATEASSASVSTAAIQAPTEARITGVLEARPTMTIKGADNITTENTVGLGYQFNPNFEIGAIQYFDTNVSSPDPARTGADVLVQDGFVRAKFNNLYKTEDFSFGYEPRVYLPTRAGFRDAGGIAMIRNYLKFAYKASPSVTLTAMELPIFHFYDRAANGTVANTAFENRVYLIADFDLGKGFALSLPLYFHQTKARNAAGTTNGGNWTTFVYTWPEITYAVSPNVTLGVAYRSDNLMNDTMSGFTLGDGLEVGAFQAILGVTL